MVVSFSVVGAGLLVVSWAGCDDGGFAFNSWFYRFSDCAFVQFLHLLFMLDSNILYKLHFIF